jgi:hypothetical protein
MAKISKDISCRCHEKDLLLEFLSGGQIEEPFVPGVPFICEHGTRIVICFVDTIRLQRQRNKALEVFKCEVCEISFQLKTGLKTHQMKGCEPKKIHCDTCNHSYRRCLFPRHLATKKHRTASMSAASLKIPDPPQPLLEEAQENPL